MTLTIDRSAGSSPWSPRESELLAVTLRLLQEHGYERLTVDAVASAAHASKATVYRRWPSKAELVLAAFIDGICQVAVAPDTGTLRGDLLQIAETIVEQGRHHASTIRAVLMEASRHPALGDALQHQFLDGRFGLGGHLGGAGVRGHHVRVRVQRFPGAGADRDHHRPGTVVRHADRALVHDPFRRNASRARVLVAATGAASTMLRPYGPRAAVRQLLLWEDDDPAVLPSRTTPQTASATSARHP